MQYRPIGKTGLNASIIGLGCEYFDVGNPPYQQIKATIDTALDGGVNIFDIFMPGTAVREAISKALGNRRKDIIIQGHIGSTDIRQQYDISRDMPTVKKYFEDMLRVYGRIELGMLFFIDTEEDYKNVFETGFADYAVKLKRDGDIGHIGFSSHNPVTAKRVIETGLVEMLMFSINPAFDMLPSQEYVFDHVDKKFGRELFRGMDSVRASLYTLCEEREIGITVMKAMGGGKLLSSEFTPFEIPLTLSQCLHYALTRPAVCSVLPGCKTSEEMQQALDYLNQADSEKDFAHVISTMREGFAGACVYCNHCQPCPAGIDIASVNKYLDMAKAADIVPPSVKSHYANLKNRGDTCVACGHCSARCPFGVDVVGKMQEAEQIFG